MKTLNRTLSLALVFALVFSLMSFAFAADTTTTTATTTTASTTSAATTTFSDQASIKNTDAVKTMVALNVINGYPDGSYKPTETVTRAQMCKMICTALNGGTAPVLGTSATAAYTDTKGTWAEAYIEYCTKLGIVSGNGDGTFSPDAGVTGSQAAKMLLVALGYDAKTESFTGPSWELNVNVRANQNSLYNKLSSLNPTTALNRDNAAQMIYNSLSADVVALKADGTYDKKTVTTSEGSTVETGKQTMYKMTVLVTTPAALVSLNGTEYSTYADANAAATAAKGSPATINTDYTLASVQEPVYGAVAVSTTKTESLGQKYLNLETVSGIMTSVGYVPNKGYTATIGGTTYTEIANDPSSFMRQKVKVLYQKDDTTSVYGIYAHKDTTIADGTMLASIAASLDGDYEVKSVVANKTYKTAVTDTALPVYAPDGTSLGTVTNLLTSVAPIYKASLGSTVKLIDSTGDGKLDCAVLDYVEVYKVGYVSSTEVTLIAAEGTAVNKTNATSYKLNDEILAYDGIAKGDYVVYRPATGNAKNLPSLTKVTTMSAKIAGNKTANGVNQVMVGTNWLPIAPVAPIPGTFGDCATGNTLTFVQVNGTIYSEVISATATADNFLILEGLSSKYNAVYAQALLADGTTKEIQLGKGTATGLAANYYTIRYTSPDYYIDANNNSTKDAGDTAIAANKLYGYAVDSEGKYNLLDVSAVNSNGRTESTFGYKAYGSTALANKTFGTTMIATDAKVFVYDDTDSKYYVTTGASVIGWGTSATTDAQEYLSALTNGYYYAKVAYVNPSASYTTTAASYGYVVDFYSTTVNSKAGYMLNIWNGTKNVQAFCATGDLNGAKLHSVVQYAMVDDSTLKITHAAYDLQASAVGVSGKDDTAKVVTFSNMGLNNGNASKAAYEVTSKTQVIYIDSKDDTTAAGKSGDGTIPLANMDSNGVLTGDMNAMYVVNANGSVEGDSNVWDLDVVVVDIANKITGNALATVTKTDATTGVTVTVTPSQSVALAGTATVTYTVTVVGTASGKCATGADNDTITLTFPNFTGAATGTAANGNTTVSGNVITLTAASAATNATYTYTGTVAGAVTPTITVAQVA